MIILSQDEPRICYWQQYVTMCNSIQNSLTPSQWIAHLTCRLLTVHSWPGEYIMYNDILTHDISPRNSVKHYEWYHLFSGTVFEIIKSLKNDQTMSSFLLYEHILITHIHILFIYILQHKYFMLEKSLKLIWNFVPPYSIDIGHWSRVAHICISKLRQCCGKSE